MAKSDQYTRVDVHLSNHHYPIMLCRNTACAVSTLREAVTSKQVFIVSNPLIASHYLAPIQDTFKSIQCDYILIPDGEEYKNQENLTAIYDALLKNHHHRDTMIIALGGGVIGDLAGFAASTYLRGVPFTNIPTTLLAQVDAAIGGKTAINHPLGKNMIGSFYQPSAVIINTKTLETLPLREFRAGIAEMIKYGILVGGEFLDLLQNALHDGLTARSPQLTNLIAQCCAIKAGYVKADEREHGSRALLNLGHTFAHALEAYTQYKTWLHGEAVAIGLYCAAVLSHLLGILDFSDVEKIESMLHKAGLPHKIPKNIDLDLLTQFMGFDKKIKNNCLRFVVIKKPGNCYLDNKVPDDCLRNALISALEGE